MYGGRGIKVQPAKKCHPTIGITVRSVSNNRLVTVSCWWGGGDPLRVPCRRARRVDWAALWDPKYLGTRRLVRRYLAGGKRPTHTFSPGGAKADGMSSISCQRPTSSHLLRPASHCRFNRTRPPACRRHCEITIIIVILILVLDRPAFPTGANLASPHVVVTD